MKFLKRANNVRTTGLEYLHYEQPDNLTSSTHSKQTYTHVAILSQLLVECMQLKWQKKKSKILRSFYNSNKNRSQHMCFVSNNSKNYFDKIPF